MTYEEAVLKAVESDIYQEIDGFFVFDTHNGFLTASGLRIIADELDKRNAPREEQIEDLL